MKNSSPSKHIGLQSRSLLNTKMRIQSKRNRSAKRKRARREIGRTDGVLNAVHRDGCNAIMRRDSRAACSFPRAFARSYDGDRGGRSAAQTGRRNKNVFCLSVGNGIERRWGRCDVAGNQAGEPLAGISCSVHFTSQRRNSLTENGKTEPFPRPRSAQGGPAKVKRSRARSAPPREI